MINSFKDDYLFLSNFYPCDIIYEGQVYPSSEHAYQVAKVLGKERRWYFTKRHNQISARIAKKMGRRQDIRADWDNVKLQVMEDILRIKFPIPELQKCY